MSRSDQPILYLVAALAGAATMSIELAAVRLLAPWFGAATSVWTNVIGVILLALSLGYLLGARLATCPRLEFVLGLMLACGAACSAWLPALSAPLARAFLPEGLALEQAGALIQWGSLACALCLFTPAALLLGSVPPLVTELLQRASGLSAGSAGGRVLCCSTLGSLLGTFGTSYVFVPRLGLESTFLGAGLVLFLLAALVWWRARARARLPALVALLAVGSATAGSRAGTPDLAPDSELLESCESTYQSVRVVESRVDGRRYLQVNESFDSFQSVWQQAAGLLPEGFYYNAFVLPAWWTRRPGEWRVCVVGLGAGTTWRVLDGALPTDVRVSGPGIEIDARVVELARRWMMLESASVGREVLAGWDGRAALRALSGPFDQVVLDAYQNQIEIPAHLSTREFFGELHAKLAPQGWLSINVGAFGLGDPVLQAMARAVAAAFQRRVLAVRVPFSRNCILFARRDAEPPGPDTQAWITGSANVDRLFAALRLPGMWRWVEPSDDALLTDDLNPMLALQQRAILEARRSAPKLP